MYLSYLFEYWMSIVVLILIEMYIICILTKEFCWLNINGNLDMKQIWNICIYIIYLNGSFMCLGLDGICTCDASWWVYVGECSKCRWDVSIHIQHTPYPHQPYPHQTRPPPYPITTITITNLPGPTHTNTPLNSAVVYRYSFVLFIY